MLNIINLSTFTKDAKQLYKRYKKLPRDLNVLKEALLSNPQAGISLGNNLYKIRLANSSIPTGKSGGFRVVYYYFVPEKESSENNLYLLTLFSKTDIDNISDDKLFTIFQQHFPITQSV